jgi:motility quorum-sensing regulator/GCU-specific mRNA interferase toxin
MEKRTPHCDLSIVRRLIAEGKVRATLSATRTAILLGFDFDSMVAVVLTLTPRDFSKSMTTYSDNTSWQDVYRPTTEYGDIYLKLTVVDDVLIVSFKEL